MRAGRRRAGRGELPPPPSSAVDLAPARASSGHWACSERPDAGCRPPVPCGRGQRSPRGRREVVAGARRRHTSRTGGALAGNGGQTRKQASPVQPGAVGRASSHDPRGRAPARRRSSRRHRCSAAPDTRRGPASIAMPHTSFALTPPGGGASSHERACSRSPANGAAAHCRLGARLRVTPSAPVVQRTLRPPLRARLRPATTDLHTSLPRPLPTATSDSSPDTGDTTATTAIPPISLQGIYELGAGRSDEPAPVQAAVPLNRADRGR